MLILSLTFVLLSSELNFVSSRTTLTCAYQSSCDNSTCAVEGDLILCECVNGRGRTVTTVWNGTAFNCPSTNPSMNDRITLAHTSPYGDVTGTCGSNIMAQGVNVSGSNYTSMLTVNATLQFNKGNVRCSVSGFEDFSSTILMVAGVAVPVTVDASVLHMSSGLRIEWTDISNDFVYAINISSDNLTACGWPKRIGAAQWEVTGLQPSQGQMCNFSLETVNACGCRSNPSSSTCVLIQVPDVVQVNVANQVYFNNLLSTVELFVSNQLSEANDCIQDFPQMNIYSFGNTCANISYESCREGMCRHVLPVTGCSEITNVLSVSTANAFGRSNLQQQQISYMNDQVSVTSSVTNNNATVFCTVNCTVSANCTFKYGPGKQFQSLPMMKTAEASNCDSSKLENITLQLPFLSTNIYSYNVTVMVDGTAIPITAQGTFQIGIIDDNDKEDTPVGAIAGGVIAGACACSAAVGGGIGVGCYCHNSNKKKKKGKQDEEKFKLRDAHSRSPSSSVPHEEGPGGDEYAVVQAAAKKKPVATNATNQSSFYQDPNDIEHKKAPETGDLYAVTEKKPKKGSKKVTSEDELAAMYSVPDKSKKNPGGLTYASLDIPGGGGNEAPQQQAPTEYATVVN